LDTFQSVAILPVLYMANLFLNKFRTESKRKKGHDYSSPGIYFITILTEAQISFFGKIDLGNVTLSPIGQIIYKYWISLPERFPSISVDEFVIMPNHLHGILILKYQHNNSLKINTQKSYVATSQDCHYDQKRKDAIYRVSVDRKNSIFDKSPIKQKFHTDNRIKGGITKGQNPMLSKNSVSFVVRWFKGRSTYEIRKSFPGIQFKWHPGYHDTIIKDKESYFAAKKYIRNNPIKWRS
jgi:putative transposase